ncbi:MAG: hypothetical protein JWP33_123 [Blastococcus sp.]|jgi:uncharacterized spore protein YtfJ|nr:hypothetical protein [Blastococcus sp.]
MRDVYGAVTTVRDAVSVKGVFGEPYEKNDVTVIPAARIFGGGGGGLQNGQDGATPDGGVSFGSGFGLMGRPAGVFVIRGDKVRWQPAVDPNMFLAVLLVGAIIVLGAVRRRRRQAEWAQRQAALPGTAERDHVPSAGTDEGSRSTLQQSPP